LWEKESNKLKLCSFFKAWCTAGAFVTALRTNTEKIVNELTVMHEQKKH